MSDIIINKHNFESAKNKIGEFSSSISQNVSIKRVEEAGGLFNWGNHKVTGEELNSRLKDIQSLMIGQNNNIKLVISKFAEVYNALDALDDDYITAILAAVNAAKKASLEAKDAQVDINRTIEALKQTVEKLKKFKGEVTLELSQLKSFQELFGGQPLQHVKDIDSIWIDVRNHSESLQFAQASHEALARRVSATVDALNGDIQQLFAFKTVLEGYQHLPQVDETWALAGHTSEEVVQIKDRFDNHIKEISAAFSEVEKSLKSLQKYRSALEGLAHLNEVDSIWKDVQNHSEGLQFAQASHEALARRVSAAVDALNGDIQQLFAFKTVLEGYQHLPQVDETWALAGHTSEEVVQIKDRFDNHIKEISAAFSEVEKSLKSLQKYRSALEGLAHLNEVDSIWKDVQNHSEGLQFAQASHEALARRVSAAVDALNGDIQQLFAFKTVLEGYQHLPQIDDAWNSTQHLKERADGCDNHLATLDKQMLDITLRMDQEQLNNSRERDSLSKRIRRNHIISSCTLLALLVLGFLYYLHV